MVADKIERSKSMRSIYKIKRAVRRTVIYLSEVKERHELFNERKWGE